MASEGFETVDPAQVAAEYEAVLASKRGEGEGGPHGLAGMLGDGSAQGGADESLDIEEQILGSQVAWHGKFLTLEEVGVQFPDGGRSTHEVVRHPGAVAVIALDGNGRILLVNQYRTALERVTREIPAGKLDLGEDAEACARRELAEETGYTASEMRYLIPITPSPGYSDEVIHIFMAAGLVPGESSPDPDEFIACEWVDLGEFINEVLDGKVEDAKTIIAAFICDAVSHRL